MKGYLFLVGTLLILISISIISHFVFILTRGQIIEMWISTILFILLFGYLRSRMLNLNDEYIFVPAFIYLLWFIMVKITTNSIYVDDDVIRKS